MDVIAEDPAREDPSPESREPRVIGASPLADATLSLAPSPLHLVSDAETVESLVKGQEAALGVGPEGVREAELARGRELDARVSEAQLDRIASYYFDAQRAFFGDVESRRLGEPAKVLFGPTARVVDHKLDEIAVDVLARRLVEEGRGDELKRAIERGPSNGEAIWDRPADPVELVAGILRWGLVRPGDKKRIRAAPELREWIGETLDSVGYDTNPRLGGVSAVGACLAGALGRAPTMMALGDLPPDVLRHMDPSISVVGSNPSHRTLEELPREAKPGGHYCISVHGTPLLVPAELSELELGGELRRPDEVSALDILVTGSVTVTGFAQVGLERMRELGRTHRLLELSGLQTLGSDQEIADYFAHVSAAHSEGMRVALLYSESKFPDKEVDAWRAMKASGCVEFLGMNTAEAYDVLRRIVARTRTDNPLELSERFLERAEQALGLAAAARTPWESGREAPEWLFRSASLLQEALGVPVLRVRGKASDVLICDSELEIDRPDRVRDHMIVSRNMGTLKVANPSGLIDRTDKIGFLRNIPHGPYLAALHKIQDEVAALGLAPESPRSGIPAGSAIPDDCYASLPDGRTCFAVPPVPFVCRRGGTQSAGDTIDVTFSSEELDGILEAAWELSERRGASGPIDG